MSQKQTQQLFNKRKSLLLTLSACLITLLAMSTQVNAGQGQILQDMNIWQPELLLRQLEAEETIDSTDSETSSETEDSDSEAAQTQVSSNSTSTNSTTSATNTTQSESVDANSTSSSDTQTVTCEEDDDECLEAQAQKQAAEAAKHRAPTKTTAVEQKAPELILLEPRSRSGTKANKANNGPCGDVAKSQVHYLATPNSRNLVQWRTVRTDSQGNCTLHIAPDGNESQLKLLKPADAAKEDYLGLFPCGRDAGVESKEFRLPKDLTCDSCTLQLTWYTQGGKIHQCSDIAIENPIVSSGQSCVSQCKNGGVCTGGVCQCAKGYSGEYCTEIVDQGSSSIWYFLLFVVVVSVIGYLIYASQRNKKGSMDYIQEQKDFENSDNKYRDQMY